MRVEERRYYFHGFFPAIVMGMWIHCRKKGENTEISDAKCHRDENTPPLPTHTLIYLYLRAALRSGNMRSTKPIGKNSIMNFWFRRSRQFPSGSGNVSPKWNAGNLHGLEFCIERQMNAWGVLVTRVQEQQLHLLCSPHRGVHLRGTSGPHRSFNQSINDLWHLKLQRGRANKNAGN